nr:MAG TPA: hypothetical protein [Caudoviricetes sp.]
MGNPVGAGFPEMGAGYHSHSGTGSCLNGEIPA